MTDTDSIRGIFFEECEDLLEALSEGLTEIADGSRNPETVNAVFRAVHSVKGGAGAFGLNDLVGFAHSFETVLDRIRSEKLALDADLIKLLQRSSDILVDLIEAARDETGIDTQAVQTVIDSLEAVLGDGGSVEEELVFETLSADFSFDLDLDAADDAPAPVAWRVVFVPDRDFYATGHEALVLIRALSDLGTATVHADLSRLPDFDTFDWEDSYLGWEILVTTTAPEAALREIFEFAEGLCQLDIQRASEETGDIPDLPGAEMAGDPFPLPDLNDDPVSQIRPEVDDPVLAAPPEPAASEATTDTASGSGEPKKETRATLRVDVDRIDRLINTVGELIINQAMIMQRVQGMSEPPSPELVTNLDDYKQLARDIQEGVMGLRTQPVKQLFQRMTRIARETGDVAGKSVKLVIEGEETEVDKKVIEKLADPLTHMIRNAIDHGLEKPEGRAAAGKSETGTVTLTACYKSGNVLIQIADDGAGLNRPRIRQIAIERNLIPEDADLSDAEIDNLLFRPGFSTAASVTSLSGRGVGMDVVKTAITTLGGRISIVSTPGQGSVFSILLPLTLAVLDGMVIKVGPETMVVPIACVEEAIRPRKRDLSRLGAGPILFKSRGDYVPVIDLGARLGQPPLTRKLTKQTLLLVQANGSRVAFAVDKVIDKRQVVIKSLAKNYLEIPGISAATILGDGKVALIVDPDGMAEDGSGIFPDPRTPNPPSIKSAPAKENSHAA